jgi:hypothetical protein
MDASMMVKVATILLGLTAIGGAVMAAIRFMGADRPPSFMAMGHGLMAAAGLTLLIYAAVVSGISPLAQIAIGILVIVALIGIGINLMYHSRQLKIPIAPILIHGIFAIAGLVLLTIIVLS